MKSFRPSILALALFALSSCSAIMGEEVARLPVNIVTLSDEDMHVGEATLPLKAGEEVGIWSEMDLEYDGNVELRFRLEVYKDGKLIQQLEVDPTQKTISSNEVRKEINGSVDWRFTGKNGTYPIEADGEYTFKSILVASDNPTLVVHKAELVLRK